MVETVRMPLLRFLRNRSAGALLVALASYLLLLAPPASSQPLSSSFNASLNGLASATQAMLYNYMVRSSPSDPRYYANGVWYATDGPTCWYCYDSAAVGAATLSQLNHDQSLAQVAIATFNDAISRYQLPSGAFPDTPAGPADGVGTGFFTVDLGIAYLEMRSTLDPATRATWSQAIGKAAAYLISSGDTAWYINGNVNLRQTEVMWLAWAATGQQRFLDAYNSEWAFTIAPPQSRWPGYGLHITKAPTKSDGSDGAGYLAEASTGAPGFDANYTDAQLYSATDLYVLTRDPRYLRLMNLEFNQLRPLINANWILNATGGTRKDYLTPFMDPAVSVLAASGDRRDLVAVSSSDLNAVVAQYRTAQTFTNANFYKGFEGALSVPLLNRQWPQGMAPSSAAAVTVRLTPASRNFSMLRRGPIFVAVDDAPIGSSVDAKLTRGSTQSPALATATRKNVKTRDVRISLKLSPTGSVHLRAGRGKICVRVVVRSGKNVERYTLTL